MNWMTSENIIWSRYCRFKCDNVINIQLFPRRMHFILNEKPFLHVPQNLRVHQSSVALAIMKLVQLLMSLEAVKNVLVHLIDIIQYFHAITKNSSLDILHSTKKRVFHLFHSNHAMSWIIVKTSLKRCLPWQQKSVYALNRWKKCCPIFFCRLKMYNHIFHEVEQFKKNTLIWLCLWSNEPNVQFTCLWFISFSKDGLFPLAMQQLQTKNKMVNHNAEKYWNANGVFCDHLNVIGSWIGMFHHEHVPALI